MLLNGNARVFGGFSLIRFAPMKLQRLTIDFAPAAPATRFSAGMLLAPALVAALGFIAWLLRE